MGIETARKMAMPVRQVTSTWDLEPSRLHLRVTWNTVGRPSYVVQDASCPGFERETSLPGKAGTIGV